MTSTINAKSTGVGGIDASGDASGVLALQTGGTTAVTIDASQNVGIGTASPSDKLDVSASVNSDLTIRTYNPNAGSSARAVISFGNDANAGSAGVILNSSTNTVMGGANSFNIYQGLSAPITFLTGATERIRIDSSGNVGIGTASPTRALTVYTTAATDNNLLLRSAAANAYITFADSGTTDQTGLSVRIGSSGNNLVFNTGGTTERMRIDSSGNVLVGTTSSIGKLNVGGVICVKSVSGALNPVLTVVTGGAAVTTGLAGLLLFQGGISGNNFWDLVLHQSYGGMSVISSSTYGTPSTRTYSDSGGAVQIALSGGTSGSYSVNYIQITGA